MTALHLALQKKYCEHRILILGFAREGESTYRFLRECFPLQDIAVADMNPPDLSPFQDSHLFFDSECESHLDRYDVIFKTPAIARSKPFLQEFEISGKVLTTQLNEFLHVYRKQVVGITGTKGKSTTSSLIAHILRENKKNVLLLGNIGIPVFDGAEKISSETEIIVEMSSYQLDSVTVSPHIAVLLNIFPEHLNYHGTFGHYVAAKSHITLFQTSDDYFFFNEDFIELNNIAEKTKAKKIAFSISTGEEKYPTHLPQIVQKNNVPPAILVAKQLGISEAESLKAIEKFQTLPHRLQKLGVYNGITFIDDTLATIPEATIAALNALPHVDVLMLGGFDRGISYESIVDTIIEKEIPTVLFFSDSGKKMLRDLQKRYARKMPQTFVVENMEEAVWLAYTHAAPDGVVLLSPASPSFGQFKNYEDKSAQFAQCIHDLEESAEDDDEN